MYNNDKKNFSAKKKSAYSNKIHDFIDKLLDSPMQNFKESLSNTDKCNTHPKKEESKLEGFLLSSKSLKTDTTLQNLDNLGSSRKTEGKDVDFFDGSYETPPSTPKQEESAEKISFEKCFFNECFKNKLKLSDIIRNDCKELFENKLQRTMKEAMESQNSN